MSLPTTGQISVDQIMTAYNSVYTSSTIIIPYNLSKIRGAMITENKTVIPQEGEINMGFFRGKEFRLPNNPPTISVSIDDIISYKRKYTIENLHYYFSDPDPGDALQFSVKVTGNSLSVELSDRTYTTEAVSLTLTGTTEGISKITVKAEDKAGESESQTFTFEIENRPPTVNEDNTPSVPTQTTIGSTTLSNLNDFFIDPDEDNLSYTATSSDEAVATVVSPIVGTTLTINGVSNGSANIKLIASDGRERSVFREFTFKRDVNQAPRVINTIHSQTQTGNRLYDFNLNQYFKDANNDNLTYSIKFDYLDTTIADIYIGGDFNNVLYIDQRNKTNYGTIFGIEISASDSRGGSETMNKFNWTHAKPTWTGYMSFEHTRGNLGTAYVSIRKLDGTNISNFSLTRESSFSKSISGSDSADSFRVIFTASSGRDITGLTITGATVSYINGNNDIRVDPTVAFGGTVGFRFKLTD